MQQSHRQLYLYRVSLVVLLVLTFLPAAQGAVVLNSSDYVGINVSNSEILRTNATGLNMNSNKLMKFFSGAAGSGDDGACESNAVVDGINANGSYSCTSLENAEDNQNLSEVLVQGNVANTSIDMNGNNITSTGSNVSIGTDLKVWGDIWVRGDRDDEDDQDLSEVLVQGNVANTSIEFQDGITIGNSGTSTAHTDAVAVGKGAEATDTSGIAIGDLTDAEANDAIAIGSSADAEGNDAIALGATTVVTADDATAIGEGASAAAEAAVAIGHDAVAPNSFEATFGALDGTHALDINVTGNATVHEGLRVNSQTFDQLSDLYPATAAIQGAAANNALEVRTFSDTSNAAAAVFHQASSVANYPAVTIQTEANGGDHKILSVRSNLNSEGGTGTPRFSVWQDGEVRIANGNLNLTSVPQAGSDTLCWDGDGASVIGDCSSLRKYKDNITDLSLGLETVQQLQPRTFRWTDEKDGRHDLGFVAEEVEQVNPLLADYNGDNLTGVKYRQLTAVLANGIQQLANWTATLEQENQDLERANEQLEQRLQTQEQQLDDQAQEIEALTHVVCENNPSAAVC